mmetsp:Transcript_11038/g.15863  ORF Transcript_11038/g.15863 Transcript_11038/m.15863 type:complete len:98 (+) Transcript_11038:2-295(+)
MARAIGICSEIIKDTFHQKIREWELKSARSQQSVLDAQEQCSQLQKKVTEQSAELELASKQATQLVDTNTQLLAQNEQLSAEVERLKAELSAVQRFK